MDAAVKEPTETEIAVEAVADTMTIDAMVVDRAAHLLSTETMTAVDPGADLHHPDETEDATETDLKETAVHQTKIEQELARTFENLPTVSMTETIGEDLAVPQFRIDDLQTTGVVFRRIDSEEYPQQESVMSH